MITPIYLASYRYTYRHGCFPWEQRSIMYNIQEGNHKMKQLPSEGIIGFALLDINLSIVADVVVTVGNKKTQISNSYQIDGSMADYRVFTLNDQLSVTGPCRCKPMMSE